MSEMNANDSGKKIMTVVLVILVILAVFFAWKWLGTRSEINAIRQNAEKEKVLVRGELDSFMRENDRIKNEYRQLADTLRSKDSLIQANAEEIKKLLNTKWEYVKVVKKLDRLRTVAQSYLQQMDSLYALNRELQAENQQIREEIKLEQRRSQQLTQEKEVLSAKVTEGAALTVYSVNAETLRLRSGDREEATDKGKRIEKIRICFVVAENVLTQPGTRTFYIRIADPSGKILAKGRGDDYTFMYKGEPSQYSATASLQYQNKATKMCVEYQKLPLQDKFVEGTYHVGVFLDDEMVGETQFKVR